MKKLYAFVLLITHLAHTSCMEKEHKTSYPNDTSISLVELSATSSNTTHHSQPIVLAPSTINPTDLIQAQKTLLEHKLLLQTRTSNQKVKDPETLYKKILELPGKKTSELIQLIEHMNNAHIPADDMAKYAYNQWVPKKEYKTAQAVLTCLYVKNYNQQASTTKECLPNYKDIIKRDVTIGNELAYSLGLASDKNFATLNGAYDNDSTTHNYPAFHTLYTSIRSITIQSPTPDQFTNFINYVYSNYTKPIHDNLRGDNLFQRTYHIVSKQQAWAISDLYHLIHIIDDGKKLNPPQQEYDLGRKFIMQHLIDSLKAAMFCHLIKEYNDERTTKQTPTPQQRKNYESSIPIFKYALPDSFDSTLFDPTKYAFKEFNKLIERLLQLRVASHENVQECIDQIYLSQK